MTAISVSERLLEMAAFYTWLDFTLTLIVLVRRTYQKSDGRYRLPSLFFSCLSKIST